MLIVTRKKLKKRRAPKIMLHNSGEVYHLPTDTRTHAGIKKELKDQFGARISNPDTYSTQ